MLARKLGRELWRQRGHNLAITIAMALAVCCFVASRNSYLDLRGSYAKIEKDLNLADWTIEVANLYSADVERIKKLDGVKAAEDRIVVSLPVVLPEGRLAPDATGRVRLEGRFITLPSGHRPWLNQLLIERGVYPQAPNEVLVEKHFADYHGIEPSTALELEIPGAPRNVDLKVSGVAVSAEYLWVSRNEYDIMPSPSSFGVFWIARDALRRYRLRPQVAAGFRAMLGGGGGQGGTASDVRGESSKQILIQAAEGYDPQAVLEKAIGIIGKKNVLSTMARDESPQTEILRTDMQSLRGFAIFFPTLFLVVGGSVVAVSLSRVIDSQRTLIGTMLAFGVPRPRILLHYLAFALVIGILGALLGIAVGMEVGQVLTRAYAQVANVPRLTFAFHALVLFFGGLFGLLTATFAGLLPACRAASIYPAQAMRPPAPAMNVGVSLLRRLSRRLPLPVRLAVRNLMRRPGRSLASVGGVAAALVLVLAGSGVVDGLNRTIEVLLQKSWRYDLRVDFFAPEPKQTLYGRLKQTEDIETWESVLTVPAQIQAGDTKLKTVVEGISPNSELLQPANMDGEIVRPDQGVVLPAALARQLGVKEGDSVRLQSLAQGAEIELPIEHITEGLGAEVFMRLDKAQTTFAGPGMVNSLLIKTKVPSWQFRQLLQTLPEVARLQDMQDLRERINRIMDFNYLLVTSMLLFSAILGIAILFTTSTLNIWERRRELATMRALGLPFPQIVRMVTLEHCLLGLIGVAVGIPFGIWAMRGALNLYECSFLTLPLVLKPGTFALAIANIFIVLLLAQWPVLLSIAHLNLADVVRERREG